MWPILEEIGRCRWERKGYLWFETDVVGTGYDKKVTYYLILILKKELH